MILQKILKELIQKLKILEEVLLVLGTTKQISLFNMILENVSSLKKEIC